MLRLGAGAQNVAFTKMHGAGNDFVILDLETTGEPSPEQCRALADRNLGVGCDMVVGVYRAASAPAVAGYRIWTPEGAPSMQCGNGGRCVAAWVHRAEWTNRRRFALESPSGIHEVEVRDDRVSFQMAAPQLGDRSLVVVVGGTPQPRVLEYDTVSTGNPHAVFVVADADAVPVDALSGAIRTSTPLHPEATIGFVEVLTPTSVKLRVHEYGAGSTRSCATGACAAVAVLNRRRLVAPGTVSVIQPGGVLGVSWSGGAAPVRVEGPVVQVYEGELNLASLRQHP